MLWPLGGQLDAMYQMERREFITGRYAGPMAPAGGDASDLNADAAWDIFLPLDAVAMA